MQHPKTKSMQVGIAPVLAKQNSLLPVKVVGLSDRRSAVFFDFATDSRDVTGRLSVVIEGETLCVPMFATRLALANGRTRAVFLLNYAAHALSRTGLEIRAGQEPVAALDPRALQSPLVDPLTLMADLAGAGAMRLLHVLLTTGPSLLSGGSLQGFDAPLRLLLGNLAQDAIKLDAVCAIGAIARVLSYRVPGAVATAKHTALVAVGNRMVRRAKDAELVWEPAPSGNWLHVFLPEGAPQDGALLVLSDPPLRLEVPRAGAEMTALRPWYDRRTNPVRKLVRANLAGDSASEPTAGRIRDELFCDPADRPKMSVCYAGLCGGGVLYMITITDPAGLVVTARLRPRALSVNLGLGAPVWHPKFGEVHVGFAPLDGAEIDARDPFAFELATVAGSVVAAAKVSLEAFDGEMPPVFEDLSDEGAATALARAMPLAIAARRQQRLRITWYGPRPAKPRVTIAVACSGSLDHPRALITLLSALPAAIKAEVILHSRNSTQLPDIRDLAQTMQAVTGQSIGVGSVAKNALSSERMRAVLGAAQGDLAVMFDQDTLPDDLAGMLQKLRGMGRSQRPRISAPVVFDPAGTLLFAGGKVRPGGQLLPEPDRNPARAMRPAASCEIFSGGCVALNRAAICRLLANPLFGPGIVSDFGILARQLGRRSALIEYQMTATSFAPHTVCTGLGRLVETQLILQNSSKEQAR